MLRVFALAAVVFLAAPVSADDKDWTGKTIKLTANVKLGRKLGGGLVRDGAALDKGTTFVVKSDDGSYLELVGQTGYIFRSEAEVVAGREMPKKGDPAPKDDKNLWATGTKVLQKIDSDKIQFGDRDADGKQTYFKIVSLGMTVVQDNGDGWVRVRDRHREGWVSKDDFVTAVDAPIYFDKAVKADPKNSWALFMRAAGWHAKGEYDNAIKDYTDYIRLVPDSSAAYHNRGLVWSAKKEYDKAIADYTEAIRLDPKNAATFSNRGLVWSAKKEYDKAITDHTEAIRLDPKDINAYTSRSHEWLMKKEYEKAIADCTEAIRIDPDNANPYNNRGVARLSKKEYDKAIADFDKVLELDPKYAYAIGNKACTLAKLKKYDEAAKGFDAAIKLDPIAWLHRDYAFVLATCPDAMYRDGKKAVELAKKAIEKAGKDADWGYFAALAAAYAEAGDFELAVAEQRKALEDKSLDAVDRKKMEARLELYKAKKPYRDDE